MSNMIKTTEKMKMYSCYLPPISFFITASQLSNVVINTTDKFQKSTERNRCKIINANGSLLLTIPVKGGRGVKAFTKDVRISYDEPWQKNHWRSISSAYGKSSYFLFYHEKLEWLYEKKFDYLIEFNTLMLETCFSMLQWDKQIILAEDQGIEMDISQFNSIEHYYQVFQERHGFIANASIIDLIFNLGPQAGGYLLKQ